MCVKKCKALPAPMFVAFGLLTATAIPSVSGQSDNSGASQPLTMSVKCQFSTGAQGGGAGCKPKPAIKNVFQQGQDRSGANNRSERSSGGSRSNDRSSSSSSQSSMGASSSPMGGPSAPMGN